MRRLGCTTINKFGFVTPLTISDWLQIVSLAFIAYGCTKAKGKTGYGRTCLLKT